MQRPPNILTIAGSDSGGGAGIQADLKTISALGGYSLTVITALTAQTGLGVTGIHAPDPDFVALQLKTVLDGFAVQGGKTGMLFSAEIIAAIADTLEALSPEQRFPLVVDPVCISQSGHRLLREDAVQALCQRMIPLADLLTPNRPEAELLTGMPVITTEEVAEAGRRLLDMGARAVLIKGGHVEGKPVMVTDWLITPDQEPVPLHQAHIDTPHTHGTGCTLSAAIATGLGMGLPLRVAVTKAQEFLNKALRHAYAPGKGVGPVHHMAGR